jgi:hypothetical protein
MNNQPFVFFVKDDDALFMGVYQALLKYVNLSNSIKELKIKIPEKLDYVFKNSPYFDKQKNKFFGAEVCWITNSEEVWIESSLPEVFCVSVNAELYQKFK